MEALKAAAKAVFGFFGSKPPEAIPRELVDLQTTKDKAYGVAENKTIQSKKVRKSGVIVSPIDVMVDAGQLLEGELNKVRDYSLANDAATPLKALNDKAKVADIEAILSFGAKQFITREVIDAEKAELDAHEHLRRAKAVMAAATTVVEAALKHVTPPPIMSKALKVITTSSAIERRKTEVAQSKTDYDSSGRNHAYEQAKKKLEHAETLATTAQKKATATAATADAARAAALQAVQDEYSKLNQLSKDNPVFVAATVGGIDIQRYSDAFWAIISDKTGRYAAAANAVDIARTVTSVTDTARKTNNELDIIFKRSNAKIEEFEQKIEKIYDDKAAAELETLRKELVANEITTDNFRTQCVITEVTELDEALLKMCGDRMQPEFSLVMSQIADSWSPYLSCPKNGDATVDQNNKIFFTRTSQAIDALCSRCVFSSENWLRMPAEHIAPLGVPPPPPPGVPPVPPPAALPRAPDYRYPMVSIGPYMYVIGPILDFQKIQGRIFIYIKCYSDAAYTKGTYFWVYRSQSEGLFRVFFKVDPILGPIEKGYDYTQATLVHFLLQIFLCNYYELHKRRGARDPIQINTLERLNYFMKKMNSLQAGDFLDNFPVTTIRETIRPSVYSINHDGNDVPPAFRCLRASGSECYYVCLTQPYISPDQRVTPHTQNPGMIGHYYVIDPKFASIISRGFPIHPPDDDDEGDKLWYNPAEWMRELRANFPDPATSPYYDFSRRRDGYQRTHPYICCFTTCCMVQPCSSFVDFLHINKYKNTFWCQGFENYTAKLSGGLPREILSPVLYVLIGALLQDSDMTLLTLRNNILNSRPGGVAMQKSTEYNRATTALMTLGTRYEDLDTMTTLYLPGIPDYFREAALSAFKTIRDQNERAYESFKTQMRVSQHQQEQTDVVRRKVEKKINMVKCLAYFASDQYAAGVMAAEQQRLFKMAPEQQHQFNLFKEEMETLMRTQVSWRATTSQLAFDTNANSVATFLYSEYTAAADAVTAATAAADAAVAAADANHVDAAAAAAAAETRLRDFVGECNSVGVFNFVPPPAPAPALVPALGVSHDDFIEDFIEALHSAFNFINASPCAAAAALFGYILNPGEYENYLIEYALLCLKKGWISGMIDDAYRALEGVYDTPTRIYSYLGVDGAFYEFFRTGNVHAPLPRGAIQPYLLKSSFDETRKKDTSRENPDPNELNVTVVTFANIYRMDCYYNSVDVEGNLQPKCMSMLYQFSSTVVYTRELNPQILYAIDNQRTPLASIPDLPEATHPVTMGVQQLLDSQYTMCATYSRICSAGGLIVGKGMEYFFEVDAQRGYYQLPFFFKYFGKFLSVCHQYYTTALIYSCNIPPYNLLEPLLLEPLPNPSSFLPHIAPYFIDLQINLKDDNGNVFTTTEQQSNHIRDKLAQNTADINAIRDWFTGEFMVDPNELDTLSRTRSASSESSVSSMSSMSSMSSQVSQDSRKRKNCNKLKKLITTNTEIAESINGKQLAYYLGVYLPYDSCGSGSEYSGSPRDSLSSLGSPTWRTVLSQGGGSLPMKRAIKKSITTRKNKNKNRTKSKAPFRRGTFRLKRMIKSKLTRNKTCKRRAPNVKHKNNKTMRRYRRVRK